jgi:hypothetical protein
VAKVRFGKYSVNLPENRVVRIGIGTALILGGAVGFLPILGFWMLPLGFIVLATDIPAVRRFNRRVGVAAKRWWTGTKSRRNSRAA